MTKKAATKKKKTEHIEDDSKEMNDLAMRIWEGQSMSLPAHERIKRIVARLKDRGYDVSKLKLPADVSRYIG